MGGDRLTRQELGWLLAQEARGAAKSLRAEVGELRASLPPRKPEDEDRISSLPMEKSLRALDDAIGLLGKLEAQGEVSPKARGRRGRVDLTTMLLELAPDCRLGLEPGAGTEVVGDEQELRRMLLLLLNSQGSSAGESVSAPEVQIRRHGSWIRISVDLGPDAGASAEVERRWLSRMAVKHGGKLELQGRKQSILLPAESSAQEEVEGLRKELYEAQQLGETYAREIATMFTSGPSSSASPQAPSTATRLDALRATCAAVAHGLSPADGSTSGGSLATLSVVNELRALCALDAKQSAQRVSIATLLGNASAQLTQFAQQQGVSLELVQVEQSVVYGNTELLTQSLRNLLSHALQSTPRGGRVQVEAQSLGKECCVSVTDGGTPLSAALGADLLANRVSAQEVERTPSLSLLACHALAEALEGRLEWGVPGATNVLQLYLPNG